MDMEKISDEILALDEKLKATVEEMTDATKEEREIIDVVIKEAGARLEEIESPFHEIMSELSSNIGTLKEELLTGWDREEKTYKLDNCTVQYKITKSLQIHDKKSLANTLLSNDQIDGFKAFNMPMIRKMKDIGILKDDVATYDEKTSVYIKVVKEE